jgi:hypothetical protein
MGTKATFYRIKGGKNLRTDSMEGTFYDPPEVGEGFRIYGKGLGRGMRYIYTSDVKEIEPRNDDTGVVGYVIHTVTGSTYGINISPDESD